MEEEDLQIFMEVDFKQILQREEKKLKQKQ